MIITECSFLFPPPSHQALCGCTVNAPTLDSRVVTVPSTDIVHPGMKRRISGEGLPYPKRPERRGDLIVEYEVKFPDRLNQSARDTIAQVLPRSWTRHSDFQGGVPERWFNKLWASPWPLSWLNLRSEALSFQSQNSCFELVLSTLLNKVQVY